MANRRVLKTIGFTLAGAVLVGALVLSTPALNSTNAAKANSNDLFDLSTSNVGWKNLQSDGTSSKKGLMLYAYESGQTASFKGQLTGTFSFDGKAVASLGTLGLRRYSLVFTDIDSKQSFAIDVNNYSSYTDVNVRLGEEKAGIHYYDVSWNNSQRLNGYTAGANLQDEYTKFTGNEAKISFDPSTMQVKTTADNGSDLLVWDFTQTYNDGKRFANDLLPFGGYHVDIVFSSVVKDDRASLLLYNFGGYALNGASIEDKVVLRADIATKAVVGETYLAPTAKGNSIFLGDIASDKIALRISDSDGNILNTNGGHSFTPAKEGTYYLYYSYTDAANKETGIFYPLQAISSSDVSYHFSYASAIEANTQVGLHAVVAIPSCVITSPLMSSPSSMKADIAIKQGENVLTSAQQSDGFSYTFDALGTYSVVYSLNGASVQEIKYVTVSADVAYFSGSDYEASYTLNSTLALASSTLYYQGKSESVSPSLSYPSGKKASEGNATLDELGRYTVSYTYQDNGGSKIYSKSFLVHESYASLFSGLGDSAAYGVMEANNTYSGLKLTLGDKLPIVYQKKIDLSDNVFDDKLEDKSKNTPLIDLFSSPHVQGTGDAEGLYIVLTDENDENNQVIIRMKNLAYAPNCSFIRTKAKGQIYAGYYYDFSTTARTVDAAQSHEEGGFASRFDMTHRAESDSFGDNHLLLYFDNASRRLFGRPWQVTGHNKTGDPTDYDSIKTPWLIRDYASTDLELSAGDKAWSGFSTGKVILSIYAAGVTSTADFYLRSVDGEDMTSEYIADTQGPSISLAYEGKTPTAQVGMAYPLPSFEATDSYCAVVDKGIDIYQGNNLVQANATSFKPSLAGTYMLSYHAKDAFGNETRKEVSVESKSKLDPMSISVNGSFPSDAVVGESVTLPSASATGGAGDIKITTTVQDGEGNPVSVSNNAFFLSKEGNYVATYTAKDYVGNTQTTYAYLTNVTYSSKPVYDESTLVLPSAFLVGDPYTFSTYLASFYAASKAPSTIHASINVTDGAGSKDYQENDVYVPQASDTVTSATVVFNFVSAGAKTSISRQIPLISETDVIGFMADYFPSVNGKAVANGDGVLFTQTSSPMSLSFARALMVQGFSILFNPEDATSFSFSFRDIHASEEKVTLSFTKKGEAYFLNDNAGNSTTIGQAKTGLITLAYDATSHTFSDVNNKVVATLSKNDDGSAFKGFDSGFCYWGASLSVGTSFLVNSINNQVFNDFRFDGTGPSLHLDSNISGHYALGTKLHLPAAVAFDVLGACSAVTASISKDGAVIQKNIDVSNGYDYTPTEYGSYSVIYSSKDSSNNTSTKTLYFTISDPVTPSLTFASSLPTSAHVGDTLKLPSYTINDDDPTTVVVAISYFDPLGNHVTVTGDSISLTERGLYRISYLAIDKNDNYQAYTFEVTVD